MKFRWIKMGAWHLFASQLVIWPAHAVSLHSYMQNREGHKKFAAKSYYPAYQEYMKALEDDPMAAELHLNLARSLEANEDFEKAEKAYKGVLHFLPKDSTLRFEALFNLGGVLAKNKKIDEALDVYQQALALDPDSIEVKTNIELLWQGGGGGGEGENQQPKDDQKEGRGRDKQDQQQGPVKKEKPQPKPFNSKDLSPQDVKKILDEIKNQEQSIRADENDKNAKQAQPDKDW